MRIESSMPGVAGFAPMPEAGRFAEQAVLASPRDSVQLSSQHGGGAAMPADMPGMIAANRGDALAAHSKLDPDRAMRLLGMLED